jgi:hypothetical protein
MNRAQSIPYGACQDEQRVITSEMRYGPQSLARDCVEGLVGRVTQQRRPALTIEGIRREVG